MRPESGDPRAEPRSGEKSPGAGRGERFLLQNTEGNPEKDSRQIEYTVGRTNWGFTLLPLAAVAILTVFVAYIVTYMARDPSIVSKVAGVFAGALYTGYVAYYFIMYVRSLRYVTQKAILTDGHLISQTKDGAVSIPLSEIVFTMSYSSSSKLCIIAATRDDCVILNCSCSYLFTKGGKEVLTPFYDLNAFFKSHNDQHIDYVKNKRYNRKNPFTVPHFVFEIEFYTKRARKFVDKVRDSYPAGAGVFERRSE